MSKIVNPNAITTVNNTASYSDHIDRINDASFDISDNPLSKVGILLGLSSGVSNTDLLLNIIGSLVREIKYLGYSDETQNGVTISDSKNLGEVAFMIENDKNQAESFKDYISNTKYVQFVTPSYRLNALFKGSEISHITDITSNILENTDEYLSFCIFNEVVGDSIFSNGSTIVPN